MVRAVDEKVTGAAKDAHAMKRQSSTKYVGAEFRVLHVLVENRLWESLHRSLSQPNQLTSAVGRSALPTPCGQLVRDGIRAHSSHVERTMPSSGSHT